MEMKEQLVTQDTLQLTPKTLEKKYFIYRYNQVIDFLNQNTDDHELGRLDQNPFFFKINKLLSHKIFQIMLVLILTFAPFINLIIFGLFFFYYFFLRRQGKVHKSNLKQVGNPFEKFQFFEETFEQLGKHCTKITLRREQEGFTFNNKSFQDLKAKDSQGETAKSSFVSIVVYDQYFYDSFFMVKAEQYKVSAWIVLSSLLIGADVLFYVSVLNLIY